MNNPPKSISGDTNRVNQLYEARGRCGGGGVDLFMGESKEYITVLKWVSEDHPPHKRGKRNK